MIKSPGEVIIGPVMITIQNFVFEESGFYEAQLEALEWAQNKIRERIEATKGGEEDTDNISNK